MSKKSQILLPRVFKDMSPDGKYKCWNGLPKISYSQYTSWKDPMYRPSYFRSYFMEFPREGSVFTEFGSGVGTWIEAVGTGCNKCHEPYVDQLSDYDREFLSTKLPYPDKAIYEDYVVYAVDGEFVIEGYIDRTIYLPDNKIIVEDFKTGSIEKKKKDYLSPDYKQTRLYSFIKESEGYDIEDCRVILLDRKGNGSEKHPMRLTGELEILPTPYKSEEMEEFIDDIRKTVVEISDNYKQYLKLFK